MTPEENAIFETACDTAFAESIEKGGCYAWLAENQSNEIIGSAVLLLFPRLPSPKRFQLHEGYLINVFTLPEWRRRGVATALVQAVVAKARELGLARIRLHATSDGQPIYKALGFENRPEAMELNL
jgi:GNAT superfamily N-acetyltransferase